MVTVTGSLAYDHIMDYPGKFSDHIMPDKIHKINLSFLVNNLSKQKGGTAGNIAYNLALFNIPVEVVGAAGVDFLDYAKFLQNAGVDVSKVHILTNNLTSNAFIMTDMADNQITAFYPGAMDYTGKLSLAGQRSDLVVIAPNNPQAMVNFCQQCKQQNQKYLIDPGMQLPALSKQDLLEMVKGAKILIGNDYEMALLQEKTGLNEQGLLGQAEIVITTLGKEGSQIKTKSQACQIKPAVCQPVDPTGAGDAYRAGFIAGLTYGFDLAICGQMGSVTACFAIEQYGTTNHRFTLAQFGSRYKENFGEELKL